MCHMASSECTVEWPLVVFPSVTTDIGETKSCRLNTSSHSAELVRLLKHAVENDFSFWGIANLVLQSHILRPSLYIHTGQMHTVKDVDASPRDA